MVDMQVVPTADKTELSNSDDSLFSGLPEDLLSSMTPAKTRMIMLWLTGQYTQDKIAKIVGVSANTVRIWLTDPAVQMVLKEIQSREFAVIDSNLKSLQNKAVQTMNELLDSNMDNVRFSAAKDLLDRAGHKPQQSIKVDKTVTTVEQQLKNLADFTISEDDVIDIDVSDVLDEVMETGSR